MTGMTGKNAAVAALYEGTVPVRSPRMRGAVAHRCPGGTVRAVLLPGLLLALPLAPATMAATRVGRSAPTMQAALPAPGMMQIRAVMARTIEMAHPMVHFAPAGAALTINDGRGGGSLTAIVGMRTAMNARVGQLVFFWHSLPGGRSVFLGWDSSDETARVLRLASPGQGAFSITYAHFAPRAAVCCPSLSPVRIDSGWSGSILISNGTPSHVPGAPVRVTLLR